jgi:DNA-directed RNA polymerase subunit M/transcription elongation factor TFIIS
MFFCDNCHHLLNIKKTLPDTNEIGYFFCDSCGYSKKIENSTLVYQSVSLDTTQKINPELAILDIYQRKILKQCSNKKCPSKKGTEVIIYKDNNFNVKYICTTCKTIM